MGAPYGPSSPDEAMLRNPNHHGHRDVARGPVAAGALVAIAWLVVLSLAGPTGIPNLLLTAIVTGSTVGAGLAVYGAFTLPAARRAAQRQADYRAAQEAEKERQIAEMKARGDWRGGDKRDLTP